MSKTASVVMAITLLLIGALGGYFISEWSNNRALSAGRLKQTVSYSPGDSFITNLKGSRQLLKTEIIIEMEGSRMQTYMAKNNHKIRNMIIDNLSRLTTEDLAKEDIRDILKSQICEDLRKELPAAGITDIYFNEFVTQ